MDSRCDGVAALAIIARWAVPVLPQNMRANLQHASEHAPQSMQVNIDLETRDLQDTAWTGAPKLLAAAQALMTMVPAICR